MTPDAERQRLESLLTDDVLTRLTVLCGSHPGRRWTEVSSAMRDVLVSALLAAPPDPQVLCVCGHVLDAHASGGCAHTLPPKVEEWTGRNLSQMCGCEQFTAAPPDPAPGLENDNAADVSDSVPPLDTVRPAGDAVHRTDGENLRSSVGATLAAPGLREALLYEPSEYRIRRAMAIADLTHNQAEQLIREADAEPTWPSIETAPKDGTLVLLSGIYSHGARWMNAGAWSAGRWINGADEVVEPSHWRRMPLFNPEVTHGSR